MPDLSVYITLFLAALLAATIIPAQSEAVLVGLLITAKYNPWLLVAVASAGNILGSVLNWLLGYGIQKFLVLRTQRRLIRLAGIDSKLANCLTPNYYRLAY